MRTSPGTALTSSLSDSRGELRNRHRDRLRGRRRADVETPAKAQFGVDMLQWDDVQINNVFDRSA
ncbi:hypothetical protein DDJ48_01625 [Mycobacteroides abscessus]|nr:hypothetical protein DDJ48_01625 [Mycobacteroides abscessus]RIT93268.1 hypothetical protein D2F00_20880 [Mycobacteroides abscessus]